MTEHSHDLHNVSSSQLLELFDKLLVLNLWVFLFFDFLHEVRNKRNTVLVE